jgi:hypothetical protein
VCFVEVFIDSPLVHRLLQLRLGVGQQFAHGLHPRVEIGGSLLGGRIARRRLRPQQQHDNGGDAGGDRQREDEKDSFRHGLLLA